MPEGLRILGHLFFVVLFFLFGGGGGITPFLLYMLIYQTHLTFLS